MINGIVGPAEITVFHPAAYQAMDGPGNRNTRSDWYDLLYPRISSIFTRDRGLHDVRRRIWTHALSSAGKKIIPDHVDETLVIVNYEHSNSTIPPSNHSKGRKIGQFDPGGRAPANPDQ